MDLEDINIGFVAVIIFVPTNLSLLVIVCMNCADDNLTRIAGPAICIQTPQ